MVPWAEPYFIQKRPVTTTAMPPDQVGLAVAVYITGADDVPIPILNCCDDDAPTQIHAVQQPDRNIASRTVVPHEVCLAIAVKVDFRRKCRRCDTCLIVRIEPQLGEHIPGSGAYGTK